MLVFERSCVYLACSKALLREGFKKKKKKSLEFS